MGVSAGQTAEADGFPHLPRRKNRTSLMKRIKNTLSIGKIIKVKRDTSVFSLFLSLKLLRSSKKDEFSSSLVSTASLNVFYNFIYYF